MSSTEQEKKSNSKKKLLNITLNIICVIIAVSGIAWTIGYFWRYLNYEITNDAFVDQYVAPVNVRVAGYIKEIRFKEHQFVNKGDTLLILDNREYLIKQKEAEAALIDAKGSQDVLEVGINISHSNIVQQEANIAEAKAKLWQKEQDFHRYERLLKERSVPQQQFDLAKSAYQEALAHYKALESQRDMANSKYDEANKRQKNSKASVLRAEAALDMANLNLSYTVVVAPYSGYMGRRTIEPGQYVSAGQIISYIVRQSGKWITANYRETQIANIYIGQPVRIKVDGLPGKVLKGHVSAISEATGSKYALVPTDNAAGNFIKVQQRIPVRIDIDSADAESMKLLRAGMMVETEALKK